MNSCRCLVIGVLISVAACGGRSAEPRMTDLELPANGNSLAPRFATHPGGGVILSWLEREGDVGRLVFSRWLDGRWSPVRQVATGKNWFINWADNPSMLILDDKRLVAHWLVRSGPDSYAYDIALGHSSDGGKSWQDLGVIHDDGTQSEHGFVSFYPYLDAEGQRQAGLVWLDGRHMQAAGQHGSGDADPSAGMTLRHARLQADGTSTEQIELDSLTCDCCQTAAVTMGEDVLVAYRDRELGEAGSEIRDIRMLRRRADGWRDEGLLNRDGWEISSCPVNGPSITAQGSRVAIAWFTAADERPAIKLALSEDAGQSFSQHVVSDEAPVGRVAVALTPDAVAVAWMATPDNRAEIRLQQFDFSGRPLSRAEAVAVTERSRQSGFPQLAWADGGLFLAWTEVEDDVRQVRAARLP